MLVLLATCCCRSNLDSDLCIDYRKLSGYTLFITGARRVIGKAIALKAAKDGANVVIAAKTAEAHPKLPGTIYTAAEESRSSEQCCKTKQCNYWVLRLCLM